MRWGLVAICALVLAPAALAATPTAPVYDAQGRLIDAPPVAPAQQSKLTKQQALAIFEANPKIAHWLSRYPRKGRIDEETYDSKYGDWTVKIWWGKAGEIATGLV